MTDQKYLNLRKYSEDQINEARRLYMSYKTRKEIVDATGININTLASYIDKWRPERELAKSEMFSALADSKKRFFVDLANNGLEILVRSLREMNRDGAVLEPKQLREISSIIGEIDKIIRLDDGNPTEITESLKPATRADIIQLLKSDPFQEIEEAEIVEPKPDA